MQITESAKALLVGMCSRSPGSMPAVTWARDVSAADWLRDGYWLIGFVDEDSVSSELVWEISGLRVAVDFPPVLEDSFDSAVLDVDDGSLIFRDPAG